MYIKLLKLIRPIAPYLIALGIVILLPIILRVFSKKINSSEEINRIISILKKKFNLVDKEITGIYDEKAKQSEVQVIEKYKSYKIIIKKGFLDNRKITVFHEFCHIFTGQSDFLVDFPKIPVISKALNLLLDIIANYFSLLSFIIK